MRESEISVMSERYRQAKALPAKYITYGYILAGLFLLFTLVTRNTIILLLFLTILSTIINYQTNMTPMRFNPQPEVFSSLLLSSIIGFPSVFVMLLVPTLFVDIYTARLDPDTFVSMVLTIIISYVISKYLFFGFVAFALILITLKFILGSILNFVMAISPQEFLFEHVLGFVSNLILILAFGNFFFTFFNN